MVRPHCNEEADQAFVLSLEQTNAIPSCTAGIVGVELTNDRTLQIIDLWYRAAKDKAAFYSSRPEQNALAMSLYLSAFTDLLTMKTIVSYSIVNITPDTFFVLDRPFVHKLSD